MGEYSYGGEGVGSAINESLENLLAQMQRLEQNRPLPLEGEKLKNELDQIAHNLEEVKEQMKEIGELPLKTQQILQQIHFLVHQYNSRFIQYSYQSLISATTCLQATLL